MSESEIRFISQLPQEQREELLQPLEPPLADDTPELETSTCGTCKNHRKKNRPKQQMPHCIIPNQKYPGYRTVHFKNYPACDKYIKLEAQDD